MQRKLLIIAIFIAFLGLNSCNIPPAKTKYVVAARLIHPIEGSTYFVGDDSTRYYPASILAFDDRMYFKRYMLEFEYSNPEDTASKFIDIKKLVELKADTITHGVTIDSLSTFKNEPITPQLIWASGYYINALMTVYTIDIYDHDYYLVDTENQIGNDTIDLYLRHDPRNERTDVVSLVGRSYDITEYLTAAQSDTLVFRINMNISNFGQTEAIIKATAK